MSSKYICRTKLINDPRVYFFYRVVDSHSKVHLYTSPDSEAKEKLDPSGKKGISRNSSKAASRDPSRPPSAIDNHIDYFREPVSSSRCTYLLMTNSGNKLTNWQMTNSGNKLTNYRHALDMFRWWSRLQSQPVWNPLNSFTWDRQIPSTGLWVILRIFSSLLVNFQ